MQTRIEIRKALPLVFGALLAALFAGCFSDPSTTRVKGSGGMSSVGGESEAAGEEESAGSAPVGEGGAHERNGKCVPVRGESLPQRSSILSQTVQPTQREVFVAELYTKFISDCGACHSKAQGLGGFHVPDSAETYPGVLKAYAPKMLERIQSDDRLFAMPTLPPVPYSKLAQGDSLRTLVRLLKE